jgi:hypothetical protein
VKSLDGRRNTTDHRCRHRGLLRTHQKSRSDSIQLLLSNEEALNPVGLIKKALRILAVAPPSFQFALNLLKINFRVKLKDRKSSQHINKVKRTV